MNYKLVLLVFTCAIGITVGQLRCYACGFSSADSDRSCLTVTNDTRIVNCPFKYCTILRQEYIDPAGVVVSFTRGCEQIPDYLNHEITDSTFRTFYRACTHDSCNVVCGLLCDSNEKVIVLAATSLCTDQNCTASNKNSMSWIGYGYGNGIDLIAGGNLMPRPAYSGENLLVPGIGSNSYVAKTCLLTLMISVYVTYFY